MSTSANIIDTRETTEDVKGSDILFQDMGLKRELLLSLQEANFITASPIQEAAIPMMLSGHDVVARAKNGTGKTASFVIPILELINPDAKYVQAVILCDTRELAMQTASVVKRLSRFMPDLQNRVLCTIGGIDIADDIERIKHDPLIVVATPQRLQGLANQRLLDLSLVRIFAIDEADKLTMDPFIKDVTYILSRCKHALRQVCLFSATYPESIESFIKEYLNSPSFINTMKESLTLRGITQYVANLKEDRYKLKLLGLIFQKLRINQCIVFVNSILRCDQLFAAVTQNLKIPCLYTSGRMTNDERNKIYHDFSSGKARVLISTDLWTRGIDIRSVNVVINFDVPNAASNYLHRIGRSGRYGHRGLAITFISSENDKRKFMGIDNAIKSRSENIIEPLPSTLETIPIEKYDSSVVDMNVVPSLNTYL